MKLAPRMVRALCLSIVLAALAASAARADGSRLAEYNRSQIERGAATLPLLARVAYRDAAAEMARGNFEAAEKHLMTALRRDPAYPAPYFTLARIKVRQFDLQAPVYFAQAFVAMWHSFRAQSLLALNVLVIAHYVLILLSLVLCFAFAVKYFPFGAHKLKEFLHSRFNAGLPSFVAYLIMLLPLVLVPGIVTTLAYVTVACWFFMFKREKILLVALIMPLVALGLFGSHLRPLTPLADPGSLTSLIARANNEAASDDLIRRIEHSRAEGLQAEKNIALGLLQQRRGSLVGAADYFFRAISLKPDDPMGYINLGNVYFQQEQYEKALEGYRKAEAIDPQDAVCKHALAQAYIKTLLMKESAKALQDAAALGIDNVKASYARDVTPRMTVYPKTFSNAQLWRMAAVEGQHATDDFLNEALLPFTRFSRQASAWILIGAFALVAFLSRIIQPAQLTFQCGNCGRLTCVNCCNNEHEMNLCRDCADTIEQVTSEKVIAALLRQKRQAVFKSRRKASKIPTMLLPGVRDINYGRIWRACWLSGLFAFSLVELKAGGYIIRDTMSLVDEVPLWKLIVPMVGIAAAYMMSIFSTYRYDFNAYRHQTMHRARDTGVEPPSTRAA